MTPIARYSIHWLKLRALHESYGSAHAWHHPLAILVHTIQKGGEPVGGNMPPFENVLNIEQSISVVASFQNFWSDDIYENWLRRDQAYRESQQ